MSDFRAIFGLDAIAQREGVGIVAMTIGLPERNPSARGPLITDKYVGTSRLEVIFGLLFLGGIDAAVVPHRVEVHIFGQFETVSGVLSELAPDDGGPAKFQFELERI